MVLNLISVNSCWLMPGLGCLKNTSPELKIKSSVAVAIIMGERMIKSTKDRSKSNILLK